ncbi:MAG: tetratricopeptide repeat protein [Alphaproteobacteria bacterium]|nr:tetratricopeptide repeat protein [Alphaproteobacteria bacterium]
MKSSIITLSAALLFLGTSSLAYAQDDDGLGLAINDVVEVVNDDFLSDADMLPMPQAQQTDVVPEVEFAPAQPDTELSAPVETEPTPAEMLSDSSEGMSTAGDDLYFDSITKDTSLRDSNIPRRVNPLYEPGSRYIVVEKDAKADTHKATLVAANRALSLGRYSSALQLFEGLYQKNNKDRHVLMGLAVSQQNSGFTQSAIATYEELLEIDPNNVNAHINMLGLLKREYPSIAYRRLVDLWEDNPNNAGLAAQIGLVSAELGNSDDAVHYLGMAASLEPNNANHFYNMAVIADRSGSQKQAISYYERALEVDATYGGSRTVPRDSIYDRLSKLRRL